ncbi:hypothetical protein C8J57DRAFT_554341 [Mycena rebaudengoi]|nr:hypothetical protein C8J57DRAFT_554341 [Mycena rebaudengoi]
MSKQAVLDFFAAGNSKDLTALRAILADDFTATILPSSLGLPIMTKEKFLAGAEKMVAGIPDLKFADPEEIIEAGSSVVVHTKMSGTGYSNEYIYIFHVAGGKIASMKQFTDALVVAALMAKNPPI